MSSFKEEAKKIKEKSYYVHIKVLVWGPGNPGPRASKEIKDAYEKRKQIRDELKSAFPRAEVFFSEDKEMIQLTKDVEGQLRKEALQAKVADVVIMLDLGRGVDLELDHFVLTYPWFGEKVYLLLPKQYTDLTRAGLVAEVYKCLQPGRIKGFTPTQFADCVVATKMAIQAAHGIALDLELKGKSD